MSYKGNYETISFSMADEVISQISKNMGEKIIDIELQKFVKPYGIEYVCNQLLTINWWMFSNPDKCNYF
jgi:hypothetical protein